MNSFDDRCSVMITYEGGYRDNELFLAYVYKIKSLYSHLKYGGIAVKYGKNSTGVKVKYDYILPADNNWLDATTKQGFIPLDGRSWHTFIPIPWLWKKIYFNHPKFNENEYTFVDFL